MVGACDGVTIKRNFLEYVSVNKILKAKETVAGALWAAVIYYTTAIIYRVNLSTMKLLNLINKFVFRGSTFKVNPENKASLLHR